MKNKLKFLIACVSLLLIPVTETYAKKSSFGGSRGFSSSRSSSSRSSGFSSNRSSSKPSSVKPSSGFSSSSSKPNVVKPSTGFSSSSSKPSSNNSVKLPSAPKSAFQIAQERKALIPPPPKDKYVSDFKKNNASKYPTTFNTPPATRPNYIPPVTNFGGKEREIRYNPETRSYGFFDDLGKFMIYDAITDIALGAFQKEQTVYVEKASTLEKEQKDAVEKEQRATAVKEKIAEDNKNFFLGFLGVSIFVVCSLGTIAYFALKK